MPRKPKRPKKPKKPKKKDPPVTRIAHVYPQAVLVDASWTYVLEVDETEFLHVVAAGITAERELVLHKLVLIVELPITDTNQNVDDAFFVDDIRPGPQVETVWGNWQTIAEEIISGLVAGYTEADFWEAWTGGNTQAIRNDINRALVSGPGEIGRGWSIVGFHQHEGDGTVTEEGI